MWGFDSPKDLVEVLLVPAVGGAIGFFWPLLQTRHKRKRFEALIARELEEMAPFPEKKPQDPDPTLRSWPDHQKKDFVHKRILQDASDPDFILSLKPGLIYEVSQLWYALRMADDVEWRQHLKCLKDHKRLKNHYRCNGKMIAKVYAKWDSLIESYKAAK